MGRPVDFDLARQELARCQESYHRLVRRFSCELVSYERMAELKALAREYGGEWRSWAMGVRDVIGQCRAPMDDVMEALFLCWQELAERGGGVSVSVQTTKIGRQRFSVKGKK